MSRASEVTLLLKRVNRGEEGAAEDLFSVVYAELRRVAGQLMSDERRGHTLQATALVHEVWIRLMGNAEGDHAASTESTRDSSEQAPEWEGQAHFLRTAARAMRNLLVDHARARASAKRGGGQQRHAIDEMLLIYEERGLDLVELSEALDKLGEMDEQLARLVELRFFGGLENRDTAKALGISLRSCERGWFSARAFLRAELGDKL